VCGVRGALETAGSETLFLVGKTRRLWHNYLHLPG
jgi:hypothetical protein